MERFFKGVLLLSGESTLTKIYILVGIHQKSFWWTKNYFNFSWVHEYSEGGTLIQNRIKDVCHSYRLVLMFFFSRAFSEKQVFPQTLFHKKDFLWTKNYSNFSTLHFFEILSIESPPKISGGVQNF
jgi:hypothetical protein